MHFYLFQVVSTKKTLYVFASHAHADHFNPEVLNWKKQKTEIRYIFSADIKESAPNADAVFLNKHDNYKDENLSVNAFGSTDIGVSFLVEFAGKKIFHAGDLNNWHWKAESSEEESKEAQAKYLEEVLDISIYTNKIDLCFFPLDPRLGADYELGAKQFLSAIDCKIFSPMHFGGGVFGFKKAAKFKDYAESENCKYIVWEHENQTIKLNF